MGNCAGRVEREESRRIDEELSKARIESDRVEPFHLCGRDEDNRFMRQLRRQFPDDWPLLSDFEREDRRQELFHVVVTKLVDLLARVEKSEENEVEGAQRVHNEQDGTAIQMNAELLNCLVGVWKNESVQAAWEQCRGEPEFEDLAYFMNNADRVLQHDSVVSIEDWGHVNLQSTGVDSHKCSLRVHSIWEIHDSSRLGCNTKKWQHMFANAKELFYVVPINEYDQGSLGDPGVNAIRSDMDEFANIVNGEFNHDKGIFLIFTNYTMFCEKLRTIPIKVLDSSHPERNRWTDYTGIESMAEATVDAREVADQGIEYFKRKFVERVEEVFSFVLDVSDGAMFRKVMFAVAQIAIKPSIVDPFP